MIQLVPEEDGGFSYVRLREEDYLYEKTHKITYLDELQDTVRSRYNAELPIDLEKMNHAFLRVPYIPQWALFISEKVSEQGYLSLGQLRNLLIGEKELLDYDAETVIRYGLAHGLFKLRNNSFGLIVEKQ